MRTYVLALFVAVTVSTAAAAEEKEPEKKAEEVSAGSLDIGLEVEDYVPAKPSPVNDLDLDLPDPAPVPASAVVVEEPLPPPPLPPELPKVTVHRKDPVVEPPPADPMPSPNSSPPTLSSAGGEGGAVPPWSFSLGLLSSVGGMAASTPRGLSVSDTGSFLLGAVFAAEVSRWEGRLSFRRVSQDRWLAANIRSDGAWEGTLHAGRWLGSVTKDLSFGVLAGGGYRSHVAPATAWWKDRGLAPSEWRAEVVPSFVWRFSGVADVTASLPFGYGFGAVDQREWRTFNGPFASLEIAVRFAFS